MPYFLHISMLTNIYASISGGGIGFGHEWHNVTVPELVRWTAVPIRHGALNGKPGTIFSRWNFNNPCYNSVMGEGISMERFKNIKRYFKLNNNLTTKQRCQKGYDQCAKFDFIYQCLIFKMNYLTLRADLDGTIDETS
jgi:hypothetical protein